MRIAPPEASWPEEYREALRHARSVAEDFSDTLSRHLDEEMDSLIEELPELLRARWQEAKSIRAGKSQPFVSNSNQLHVPQLPAVPFYDRAAFPELGSLEAKTGTIIAELEALLAAHRDDFRPYIQYQATDPVNQWRELNHSSRWSALHLWRGGEPVVANLERCPETAAALAAIGMADIDGLCPNALFSALAPRTHIPPHHGESNARLVAHLPLIVPDGCRLRVGFEERQWTVGECLIFDDTLEHEAFNDSDELRVVLIFDLWNPQLSDTERRLTSRMARASREFQG